MTKKGHEKQSQVLPLNIDPIMIQVTGTVTIPDQGGGSSAATQRGLDAVKDLGLDNSGKQDCSAGLGSYLNSSVAYANELHFPPGRYYFSSTVETNAKCIKLVGDGSLQNMGDAPVIFFTDQPLKSLLWWNGSQTNSNMNGPRIDNIQFQDSSSGHNLLGAAIRLTATANSELNIGLLNLRPQRYVQGTVSVSLGSKTVQGTGTAWTAAMESCAWLVIDGYPYEVLSVQGPAMLTLAIAYQGPSANGKSYAINWGGVGVWCEPGTDFTQYGKNWSLNGRCGCALFASAGSTSPKYTGTSRIKVKSGYLNGEGIPDSMAAYFGPFSDTFQFDVAMNSYAYFVVIANGHQHDVQHLDCENAGGPPPVTGKPTAYDSGRGVLVISDNSNDAFGNRIGGYFRQVGTGIELCGQPGKAPQWTIISASTFRSNKTNFINGNASNTQTLGQLTLFEEI
jgi:hypothetical protein